MHFPHFKILRLSPCAEMVPLLTSKYFDYCVLKTKTHATQMITFYLVVI